MNPKLMTALARGRQQDLLRAAVAERRAASIDDAPGLISRAVQTLGSVRRSPRPVPDRAADVASQG